MVITIQITTESVLFVPDTWTWHYEVSKCLQMACESKEEHS
jgi:hypothetical protein